MKVIFPNGITTNDYGLLDTGSNKTLVSKAFQQKFRIKTHREQVTLNGVGSSSTGPHEVAQFSLQSLVNPNHVVNNVEAFVIDALPVNSSHIPRQVQVDQYDYMKNVKLIELPCNEVSLLIGTDLAPPFAPFESYSHSHQLSSTLLLVKPSWVQPEAPYLDQLGRH